MMWIGIDPGASGGLAFINRPGEPRAIPMPKTERDIWNWMPIDSDFRFNNSVFAVIEKVGGYIGKPQPGSAMFKFGASYGGLRMALIASGIPFDEVTPQAWQKGLGIVPRKKDESKTAWKNRLKAKAQQFFPGVGVTLKTCDALLIAEYCRRKRVGQL